MKTNQDLHLFVKELIKIKQLIQVFNKNKTFFIDSFSITIYSDKIDLIKNKIKETNFFNYHSNTNSLILTFKKKED